MTSRHRLIVAIGLAALFLASAAAFTLTRMARWQERGWLGVTYAPYFAPAVAAGRAQRPAPYGSLPGEVLMTYRGSPADGRLLGRDRIVAINGIPVEDVARLRALDKALPRDATVHFRVQRGASTVDVPLQFASPFRTPYILVKAIVAFGVALTFAAVGLLVFAQRPEDRRAAVFAVFSVVSAVAIIGSAGAVYENSGGRGLTMAFGAGNFASIVLFLFSLAYAPLVLHLSLIFPQERPIVARRVYLLRWIYAAALLAALISAVLGFLFSLMMQSGKSDATYRFGFAITQLGWTFSVAALLLSLFIIWRGRGEGLVSSFVRRPFLAVFAVFGLYIATIGLVGQLGLKKVAALATVGGLLLPLALLGTYPIFAIVSLVRSYRSAGVEEKRQVQWPLWGLLIAVTTKILSLLTIFVFSIAMSAYRESLIAWRGVLIFCDVLPTIMTLLIPLSFAAAILKYRLMNIDVIIRKTVGYAILSATIVILYLGLVGGLGSFMVYAFGLENQTTMIIGSTMVVALLFVPLRNKLQTLVDRNLFRQRYDYPEALRTIAAEARTTSDAGAFLTVAAEKLQQALQNRAVVVFVERQDDLVAVAKIGVADSLLGRLRIPRAVLDSLDRPLDPRRRALDETTAAAFARIDAVLAVPIGTRGCLAFAPKLTGGGFDVEDIAFLRAASDEIAMKLDRIRMVVEEEDYAEARAIQQTLLPREIPAIEGVSVSGTWQPARTMGGDYFDVLRLGDQQLAVCIGDVAGKGMPAALLMSGLQAAVRASASDSPRDLCERVRRVVITSLAGGRFVTFFYAVLDTAAMRLRWCNAGHNAPVLVRADGAVLRLEEGGPAFTRLFRGTPYRESEIDLQPGDRLVLFTDGVSEVMEAATGEMFGESRIEELVADGRALTATELQQTVVDAVLSYGSGELEDDLTLVVAAVEG
jgi:serine phosphatase RsbU (regulator of sigma subunit)